MQTSQRLRRVLTPWDGVAIAVGVVIGSGIFRTPGPVAAATGSVGWSLFAWVLGGGLALIDALIIAELASLYPRAGGNYVYLRHAYGPFPAFLNGWLSTFVTYPASMAGLAVFFAECVARLLGRGEAPSFGIAYGTLAGLGLINALGLRYGRTTQAVFAAGKLLLLLAIVVLALTIPPTPPAELPAAPPAPSGLAMIGALGIALLAVMWTYDGYADVAVMAGEMRTPGRSIPRALFFSLLTIITVYLLANIAFFIVLPFESVAGSTLIVSDVAAALLGPIGDRAVTVIAMVSAFGALNGVMIAGPRVTWAIAHDGLMFRRLSYITRGQTPLLALALQIAVAIALTFNVEGETAAFETLSGLAIFVIWVITFFASLSLLVFRLRYPDSDRPFRLPLYPWTFLLHIVVSLGFLVSIVTQDFDKVKIGLWMMLAGVPAYLLWTRLYHPPTEQLSPEESARREEPEETST